MEGVGRDDVVGIDPRIDLEAKKLSGGAAADGSGANTSARDTWWNEKSINPELNPRLMDGLNKFMFEKLVNAILSQFCF